eukprot:2117-Prymnesium_polylepis.1
MRVSHHTGGVISPLTASGYILAASADSRGAVVATTYGEWIAPTMLAQRAVPLPCSLCNLLSYLWPAAAQAYYDALLEPLLPRAAFPALRALARGTPAPLRPLAFVAVDAALAAGFAVWALCSATGAATAALMMLGAVAGRRCWARETEGTKKR